MFWPNATTCSVITPQRRSHASDLKNPIGVCPRRIGAPTREAYSYQSINADLAKACCIFRIWQQKLRFWFVGLILLGFLLCQLEIGGEAEDCMKP